MDKLKSLFRPGGEHDDQTLYGTPEHSGQQTQTPAHLTTDAGAEKKEGGIMRQILNPGGDKYDEERFGTTAHADKPLSDATTGTPSNALEGTEASSRPPNLTQISSTSIKSGNLGPYAGRTDGRMVGEGLGSTSSGTVGQQSLPDRTLEGNSSGQQHLGRDAALGGAAAAGTGAAGYEAGKYSSDPSRTTGSDLRDSTTGTQQTERAFPLSGGSTTHSGANPTSTSQTTDPYSTSGASQQPSTATSSQPEYGRDAALAGGAGAGALGAGALAHEANKPRGDSNTLGSTPTTSGNISQTYADPVTAARSAQGGQGSTGLSGTSTDPYTSSGSTQQPTNTGGDSHLGRDAGIVGAGALGAGALGHEAGRPEHDDSTTGSTQGTSGSHHIHGPHHSENEAPAEGYVHHTHGPHALDIANRLDPHVPGEFPDASGQDRHNHGREAGLAGAGLGAAGLGAAGLEHESNRHGQSTGLGGSSDRDYQPSSTTGMTGSAPGVSQTGERSPNDHHLGRDAGIAGGVGAAGLGAHELRKEHESSANQPTSSGTSGLGSSTAGPTSGTYGSSGVEGQDPSLAQTSRSQPEHHLGRDAAVAGGVGAAGLGAHELRKDHASGVNQPTSGSGVAGSSGAPVTSAFDYDGTRDRDPSMAQTSQTQPEHHRGRDAALGAGAGAAGLGAYEATKEHGNSGVGSSSAYPHDSNNSNIVDPREKSQGSTNNNPYQSNMPNQMPEKFEPTSTEKEHHYGRDAALAGGAGAAGLGAYEATKDRGNTGPAHGTTGPHESNVANIADPRVQPQTEKLRETAPKQEKEHHSLFHHGDKEKSQPAKEAKREEKQEKEHHGLFHRGDKDKSHPAEQTKREEKEEQQHHYGRDAALAGGAGAAGVGAYEANKEFGQGSSTDPTTQQNVDSTGHHEPNKLHKRNDPRGHPELLQEDPNYTGPGRNASVDTTGDTPRSGSVADPNTHERRRHEYLQDQRNLEASGSLLTKHEKDRHEHLEHERMLESEGLINKHEHDRHEHLEELREDEAKKAAAQPEGEQKKKSLLEKIMYVGSAEGH